MQAAYKTKCTRFKTHLQPYIVKKVSLNLREIEQTNLIKNKFIY